MIQVNEVEKIYLLVKELKVLHEEIAAIKSISCDVENVRSFGNQILIIDDQKYPEKDKTFLSEVSMNGTLQIMGILIHEKEKRIYEIVSQLKKYGIAE